MKLVTRWAGSAIAIGVASTLALSGCATSGNGASTSDDTITLRLAGVYGESHYLAVNGPQFFIDEVERLSNGRVEIEYFPSNQLGKPAETMGLLESGVADIAMTSPGYLPSQMPLSGAFSLPQAFEDGEVGTNAYASVLADPDSAIYIRDFADNNLTPLFGAVTGDYEIMTTKTELKDLESFEGLSLRSAGGTIDFIIQALGATPIQIPSGEIYQAMERGTVDGNLQGLAGATGNSLQEVTKYVTTNGDFTSFVSSWTMSTERFEGLPQDVQKILQEAGVSASAQLATNANVASAEAIELFEAEGATLVTLSDSDLVKLKQKLSGVRDVWLETVSKDGFDGEAALSEMESAVERVE